jgi:hypothetical protein
MNDQKDASGFMPAEGSFPPVFALLLEKGTVAASRRGNAGRDLREVAANPHPKTGIVSGVIPNRTISTFF